MKKKIIFLFALLINLLPVRLLGFIWLLGLMILIRQDVEKPSIMDRWEGFFEPQIKVISNISGGGAATLGDGECTFLQPTRVLGYKACCDAQNRRDKSKEWYAAGQLVCDDGSLSCMCARRVLVDCKTGLEPDPELGCFAIPLSPPPPPFAEQFTVLPSVKILPVRDSSFFNPQIKVMVGVGNNKKCADGNIISLSDTCAGFDRGVLHGYTSKILSLNLGGGSQGKRMLSYGGQSYIFDAQKRDNQICGLYYGNNTEGVNDTPISSVCYDIPYPSRPEVVSAPDNITDLLINDSNINIAVRVPGYNNDQPFNLNYNRGGTLHQDTGLELQRLHMNDKHFIDSELLCHNVFGDSVVVDVNDSPVVCPFGYSHKAELRYKEDENSNALCILERNGSDQYMLTRGNTVYQISELGKAFVPHSYFLERDKWVVDYSMNHGNLFISDVNQEFLDKIQNFGPNLFLVHPEYGGGKYHVKYTKVESIAPLFELPFEIQAKVDLKRLDAYEAKKYNIGSGSASGYTVASTYFIDSNTKKPFFFTSQEARDALYLPLDPYLKGLCITNFPHYDYTDADQEGFVNITDCDFVDIEAWGGGAAGHILADGDPFLVKNNNVGRSFSGASGGYTRAVVKADHSDILKIKVGKGGNSSNSPGEVTSVYGCDINKENCSILLSANGAGSFGKEAEELNVSDVNAFDPVRVLQVEKFSGMSGVFESVTKRDPDVPEPLIVEGRKNGEYVASKESFCYNRSDSLAQPKAPGMGGCVSRANNVWQQGADGKVKITCERWSK